MNILVIGSGGFIGYHLCVYLKAGQNHTVCTADISAARTGGNHYILDAGDTDFEHIFIRESIDVCINCSGAANVQLSFADPDNDFRLNTTNVERLLSAIRKHRPDCRFINLSSAAVYGNPQRLPISEDDAVEPLSPYGHHKLMSEQLCKEYASLYNIKAMSIRIFSAYGEGLRKQLFWDLLTKIKNNAGHKIILYGTGNESRDFIHASDIAAAINCIIQNGLFHGEVINIASGSETSIKEAVHLFTRLLGSDINIEFSGENKIGDPVNWRADISKLRALGFTPSVSLEHGLKKYQEWLRQNALV